jgi:uncharacterized membrane protein YtjA (UPF0391 family)
MDWNVAWRASSGAAHGQPACVAQRLLDQYRVSKRGAFPMLYWAIVFFIVAIIAGVFGFFGIATAAAGIAKFLFLLFAVLFVLSLILGMRGRTPPL